MSNLTDDREFIEPDFDEEEDLADRVGGGPAHDLQSSNLHALGLRHTMEALRGEHPPVTPPYYEVTIRLPLDLYDEYWFERVAESAGDRAAVSGTVVPGA